MAVKVGTKLLIMSFSQFLDRRIIYGAQWLSEIYKSWQRFKDKLSEQLPPLGEIGARST